MPKVITTLVLATAGAATAHAQSGQRPRVSLEIAGDCPSREIVARGLSRWVDVVEPGASPPAWRLEVVRAEGSSTMRLRAPGAVEVSVSRTVESDDCDALGETFVYVVQARFVELAMLPPEVLDAPTPTETADTGAETGTGGETGAGENETETATTAESETETAPADERPPRPPARRLSIGVAGGAQLAAEPTALTPSLAAHAGVWLGDLLVRAAAGFGFTAAQTAGMEEIEVTSATARLELGTRVESDVGWLEPTAGLGAGFFSVTALTLPGEPSLLRVRPLAGVWLGAGLPSGSAVALRAELGAALLPFGDSYVIRPSGEVGRSPRALLTASLGVQTDLFW